MTTKNQPDVKRTLLKDVVGCVRRSDYESNLPHHKIENHSYGKPVPRDSENASVVISQWKGPTPSSAKQSSVSKIAQNKLAVKNSCVSSAEFRKFQRDPANQHRIKNQKSQQFLASKKPNLPSHARESTFGCPTQSSDANMRNLICGSFTNFEKEESDYPDLTQKRTVGKLPKPLGTKASAGHNARAAQDLTEKHAFKMKKFSNIEPKVKI